ncbi:MAG: ABC transporter ATP-binding protein [Proteobacteria bacterium]|nr:ABC transporter ATP-binding protein [Pseudomonadota bacterium]MDA1059756.1 ABC transporter ATP-binding protein [Pseudomonadota bacterium]
MNPVLSVRDVKKSFGRVEALRGVSLSLDQGEFVALLGQNGAGKSTLFQLLSGLFVPDDGTITVAGFDIRKNAVPALAKLGIVFQAATLDPELSVRANLVYHTRLFGIAGRVARKRIEESLDRFGLTDRAADKARTLSGGNRRRVELARALIHKPEILLMDEPTVGLDPASRRDLLNHVIKLCAEERIGVLWATHLVDEAELANRVVVLHKGLVLRNAPPQDLIQAEGTETLADAFLQLTKAEGGGGPPPA